MKADITLKLTPKAAGNTGSNDPALAGHWGTHFDVMDKEFPLDYTERRAVVFDVSAVRDRDITAADIDMDKVEADMFVAFCTGFVEELGYGEPGYFKQHPQLSPQLIETLLDKRISIIGVDCAGIRRGKEHTPADRLCADRGVFVVENLCHLRQLVGKEELIIHTYPMNYLGVTGLPCRVVAEILEQ